MEPSTSDKFWAALQNSWRRASVIVAVTEIRNTAATLLVAQKITKADAENIQKQADVMREGLVVVRGLADTDVSTAAGRLAAIQASLRALQAYLLERSK